MSTTGSWNTRDAPGRDTHSLETSQIIPFAKPFVSSPKLPFGLNYFDISTHTNIRVAATTSDITKESFKVSINSWGDTHLVSAGISWLEVSPGHLEYQSGEFSTQQDHPSDKPQTETSRRIIFDRPFPSPPKVIVFLRQFDMARNPYCRVVTKVSGIDASGFTIHINTWADSILYSTTAGWIAYPEDREHVFSCTASTEDIRHWTRPAQLKHSKRIDFGGPKFWKTPNIFMAINQLDFSCKSYMRIKVEAKDVTQTGLTWHIDSWLDPLMVRAGVSILAVV
ncbi:hypothetical protein HOY82DRAFT_592817 [Tuber indicum]|nr:hypothetical protein HOY82DRAFT_592817 [Tuber indicum]